MDTIFDVFMEPYDPIERDQLNELLEVPLGVHPEATPKAKARRAEIFNQQMDGM